MSEGENTRVWYVEIWYKLQRLYSDILYLFEPNKLFVLSWMKFKGIKMLHNNWGDDINLYFFESISNIKVKNIPTSLLYRLFTVKGYSCIGSILGAYPAKSYEVWGSGLIKEDFRLQSIPKKIHSVRGPLTRQVLLNQGIYCPEAYGDPALLISRYYRKYVDKKYSCGIIPHYCDENNPILQDFCRRHPECLLIKMRDYDDWHDIPDQIMMCCRIISSSLHGLIIADSYGVPNVWVKFSDKIVGDDFKYQDYFHSVGRVIDAPYIINNRDDLESILDGNNMSKANNIDYRSIYEVCPFKNRLKDFYSLRPQLPQYKSWQDKNKHYFDNLYVRTKSQLDDMIKELGSKEKDLLFLGVNDAKCKIFASSQIHWMQMSDCMLSLGTTNYYNAIDMLVASTKNSPKFKYFIEKQQNISNLQILAYMQHFGVPSPMIHFSHSLREALFPAFDGVNSCDNNGSDTIDDYVSLYYLSKKDDWVSTLVYDVSEMNIFMNGAEQLNKSLIYISSNDDVLDHNDIFIINNTIDQPLVEVMNNKLKHNVISCLNIRKDLASYVKEIVRTS